MFRIQVLTRTGRFGAGVALAAVFGMVADGRAQATVEGTVILPEKRQHRRTSARYHVLTAGKVGPQERPTAVVYLESPAAKKALQAVEGEMRQKNLRFLPEVLPITVGSAVRFPNQDDEYHNVLSYSFAKEFDLGRYLKTAQAPTVIFEEPGLVEVNCEIHEHMRAFILVLETPYFTKASAEGRFQIKNVPAGRYALRAWVNDRLEYKTDLECADGETVTVHLGAEAE